MQNTYYTVRAIDCFGDTWPLGPDTNGIDGVRHATKAEADKVASAFSASKDVRKAFRLANGWQQGTIRGVRICEIVQS